MADQDPEASPAPTETPRFSRDGELLPEQIPQFESPKGRELPHELFQARVAIVAGLKTEGYSRKQIAKALQMSVSGVAWCIRKARERKLLVDGMTETLKLIEDEALPLAVEGLLKDLRLGNQTAYLETLKGRGLLRNYTQVKQEGGGNQANMAFQFNFVTPDGQRIDQPDVPALPGQVFGTAKTGDE